MFLTTRRLSLSSPDQVPQVGRRGSIQDSLISFSKNFSLGAGNNGGLNKQLSRSTAQHILASHFKDKKLKVKIRVFSGNSGHDSFSW